MNAQVHHKKNRLYIFVLGTGRSGTHWLANTLIAQPEIKGTIEKPGLFDNVTRLAINPTLEGALLPVIVREYRLEHKKVSPCHYLDKSHPAIWFAELLYRRLPNCRFLIIRRNPYQVVSSSLQHEGVRRWCEEWDDNPVENRFLGVGKSMLQHYKRMSLVERLTIRWGAHLARGDDLKNNLPDVARDIIYEELQVGAKDILGQIAEFIGLSHPIPIPSIRRDSMTKWRKNLSPNDVRKINQVIKTYYPQYDYYVG